MRWKETWNQKSEDFLRQMRDESRLTQSTLKEYAREIKCLKDSLARQTWPQTLQSLVKLAPTTHVRRLIVWRQFLEFVGEGDLAKSWRFPKVRAKNPRFLTDEEAFRLEQATYRSRQSLRDRLIVALGLQLGLRLSDMLGLRYRDIHQSYIRVLRKGEKEQRLPLPPSIESIIRQIHRETRPELDDFLLINHRGQPLTSRGVQKIIDRLRKEAGIQRALSPHALRHTFASTLAARGASLTAIKELMGHERLSTTERYLHVTPAHLKETLQLLQSGAPHRPLSNSEL